MIIKDLDYANYKGKKYKAEIHSDQYLSIERYDKGFSMEGYLDLT